VKGAIAVILSFLLLPGAVIALLSANFGALKGYLIGAVAFFGFLFMLTLVWTFGLPGTPALTGPTGPEPHFVEFTKDSPEAAKFPEVANFNGTATNGWQTAPEGSLEGEAKQLQDDLTAAEQTVTSAFITEGNRDVTDSSKELDATNIEPQTFYTTSGGTTVAATVISPKDPPQGSGLTRPTFQPVTEFAYQDPGFQQMYNFIFMGASLLLFLLHVFALGRAERRNPLNVEGAAPAREPATQPRQPARV
jgi:hypothetical protein